MFLKFSVPIFPTPSLRGKNWGERGQINNMIEKQRQKILCASIWDELCIKKACKFMLQTDTNRVLNLSVYGCISKRTFDCVCLCTREYGAFTPKKTKKTGVEAPYVWASWWKPRWKDKQTSTDALSPKGRRKPQPSEPRPSLRWKKTPGQRNQGEKYFSPSKTDSKPCVGIVKLVANV